MSAANLNRDEFDKFSGNATNPHTFSSQTLQSRQPGETYSHNPTQVARPNFVDPGDAARNAPRGGSAYAPSFGPREAPITLRNLPESQPQQRQAHSHWQPESRSDEFNRGQQPPGPRQPGPSEPPAPSAPEVPPVGDAGRAVGGEAAGAGEIGEIAELAAL